MPIPALVAGLGTTLLGGLFGGASANAARKAGQAAQRNLPNEINTLTGLLPSVTGAAYGAQQQYGGLYNSLGLANLNQGLFGDRTVDARGALAAMSPQSRAEVEAEAARTGRTPEQWLTDHTLEQARAGDPVARQGLETYGGYTGGLVDTLGLTQGMQDQLNAASATTQRTSNLADMQALAPGAARISRELNPEFYGNLDALDAEAGAAGTPGIVGQDYFAAARRSSANPLTFADFTPERVNVDYTAERVSNALTDPGAPSAIEAALQRQALDELALGDQLSGDEARQVRVQSRAAADARGRGFSNAALADEVLNTANARRARSDARRGFALTTNQALRAGQAADRSYALGRDQFRAGVDQFNAGLGLSAAQLKSENQRFNAGLGLSAAELNRRTRLNAEQFNASRIDADRAALAAAAGFEQGLSQDAYGRRLAATSLRSQSLFNPSTVLGQVDNRLNSTTTLGLGQSQFQGAPDYLGQLFGYGQDVFSTNANARGAAGIAGANTLASAGGGILSGLGGLFRVPGVIG